MAMMVRRMLAHPKNSICQASTAVSGATAAASG